MLVSGGIGSGKTALQEELLEGAAKAGALTLSATGARDEQQIGAAVIDQMLANTSAEIDVPSLTRMRETLPGDPTYENAEARVVRDVCDALLGLARERPVVIGVDDLHFADETSLKLLLQLQRRIRCARILIVLTQPDWQSSALRLSGYFARQPRYHAVQLAPLSVHSIEQLLTELTDDAEQRKIAASVHTLSAGNPMLAHALIDDYRHGTGSGRVTAGPFYTRAVGALLGHSDAQLLDVAAAVAILDRHSSVSLITRLTSLDTETVVDMLEALHRAGLLVDGVYHEPTTASSVLGGLSPSSRARLHAHAAELKHGAAGATEVAAHLVAAGNASAGWAVPLLRAAAYEALLGDDVQFAGRCLELALASTTEESERRTLQQSIVRCLWRVSPSAVTPYVAPLRELVVGDPSSVRVGQADCFAVMRHALWHGDRETYLRAREVLRAAPEPVDPQSAVELDLAHQWHFGPRPVSEEEGESEAQRRSTPWDHTADSLLGMWRHRGDEATLASAERLLHNCRLGDTALEAIAMAVATLVRGGRTERADRWCVTLSREAHHRGAVTWEAMLESLRAEILLRSGELSQAAERADAALEMLGDHNWGVAITHPLTTLLQAQIAVGDLDAAGRTLKRPVPEAAFRTAGGMHYLRAWGHYQLATNRPLAAAAAFQRCQRQTREWEDGGGTLVPWRSDLAEANLQLGHVAIARDLARQQVELAVDTDPYACGLALRVLAMAAAPSESAGIINRAAKYFRAAGHLLEMERTLKALEHSRGPGRPAPDGAARATGPAVAMGRPATRGQFVVRRSSATREPTVKSAAERREVTPGPAAVARPDAGESTSLSEAELRVVQLAASGHTNRQISSTLFITVSTVEQHLTRAYKKLGISGRSSLATVLGQRGLELTSRNGASV
ncbi:helix-turn-helix transcriptional regulator [Streptomyces lancefieldiae]|uniref:helix-turn-helix transcriptional regulator n=1 Tax=Streptomyces lancefieldiae TaxID=3075520 RepID=UPI00374E02E9